MVPILKLMVLTGPDAPRTVDSVVRSENSNAHGLGTTAAPAPDPQSSRANNATVGPAALNRPSARVGRNSDAFAQTPASPPGVTPRDAPVSTDTDAETIPAYALITNPGGALAGKKAWIDQPGNREKLEKSLGAEVIEALQRTIDASPRLDPEGFWRSVDFLSGYDYGQERALKALYDLSRDEFDPEDTSLLARLPSHLPANPSKSLCEDCPVDSPQSAHQNGQGPHRSSEPCSSPGDRKHPRGGLFLVGLRAGE